MKKLWLFVATHWIHNFRFNAVFPIANAAKNAANTFRWKRIAFSGS